MICNVVFVSGVLESDSCIWKVKVLVAQLCPVLFCPMDCSQPGSSVLGVLQARILYWVAITFSSESFQPRDQTRIPCIGIQILYNLRYKGDPQFIYSHINSYMYEYMYIFIYIHTYMYVGRERDNSIFSFYSFISYYKILCIISYAI